MVGIARNDTLNVRAGPGANNKITATRGNGTTYVEVVGASVMNGSTEWVPIKSGDRTGWVTKQHLQHE